MSDGIQHRDGIPWDQAPIPRRWHRCTPQTTITSYAFKRCACGAHNIGTPVWYDRNSRRMTQHNPPPEDPPARARPRLPLLPNSRQRRRRPAIRVHQMIQILTVVVRPLTLTQRLRGQATARVTARRDGIENLSWQFVVDARETTSDPSG